MAASLIVTMETDTTPSFVSPLKDIAQQFCTQPPRGIHLEFDKYGYVLGGLGLKLQFQDKDSYCTITPFRYPKWHQWIFETVLFGSRRAVRNRLILLSATPEIFERLSAAKVLFLLGMATTDSSIADGLALVDYTKWTNASYCLDEKLACVCLRWSTDDRYDYTPGLQTASGEKLVGGRRIVWGGTVPWYQKKSRSSLHYPRNTTIHWNAPLVSAQNLYCPTPLRQVYTRRARISNKRRWNGSLFSHSILYLSIHKIFACLLAILYCALYQKAFLKLVWQ